MILQERDRHTLRELAVMRITDRELTKVVSGFGSTTRANIRLLALHRAGLLRRAFISTQAGGRKAIYWSTPKAAALVDVPYRGLRRGNDDLLIGDLFVEHQMAVNRLYARLKYLPIPIPDVRFSRWQSFFKPLATGTRLIPDGYVEFETPTRRLCSFLEVDLGTESLRVWKEKVDSYSGYADTDEYRRRFNHGHFRVSVVVSSERRMHSIRKAVAAVTEKGFQFATLKATEGEGFWGTVWYRPKAADPKPFITP